MSTVRAFLFATGCAGLLAGCGPNNGDLPSQGASDSPAGRGLGAASNQRQVQADFLDRIRQSDPHFETIQKAVLNQNNELGLILSRNVQMDSIPALMRAMLGRMSQEFPNQDLTVVAYAPSQPPVRIGTAHLDARTRQMTYTPEHQNRNQ